MRLQERVGAIGHLKNFYHKTCLVLEIQLFVYIFGRNSKWPPEVRKGSLVKIFDVSYYLIFFSSLQFIKVKIEGYQNALWFFYTFVTINQQTAGLEKCFVHLMRCLNCWDDKKFWGVQSVPPSPATSVNALVCITPIAWSVLLEFFCWNFFFHEKTKSVLKKISFEKRLCYFLVCQ